MEKRKLNRITAGFIVLVVMVLILMFSNSLRRSSHITLPEEGSSPGQAEDTNASGGDALTVIAVTPETVQTAIETLTRPRQYSRVIRVEQLWDGGSGSFETTVTVSGRWTRTDRSLSDGQVRHTITDGEITYIWYGSESSVYSAPAGDITPDDEQAIPTYETILDLPVEDIAAADYRSVSDVNCIYVETVQDPEGYTQRYWVSVETGLLVASERLLEGETIWMRCPWAVSGLQPEGVLLGEAGDCDVEVTLSPGKDPALHLVPKILVLGVGCRSGVGKETLAAAVAQTMERLHFVPQAIARVCSIDLKKEEPGLLAFCAERKLPFLTYSPEELAQVTGDFTPSEFVRQVTGIDNVCERSAVLGSGGGPLLQRKCKGDGVTLAVAQIPFQPEWRW